MSMIVPQRILIAPSGFKESLSAPQVARAIAAGVRRVLPGANITAVPVPDGGEGTAEALADATGGSLVPITVTGPVGDPVTAAWARLGGAARGTAVVEMASAAGLSLVPADRRDPTRTTTHGVGELIRAALDDGARRILIGCGDSGTSDGGAGALQALGARILDADGRDLPPGGGALARADRLDLSGLHPGVAGTEIVVACNPHNVLCGPAGVARVFAAQKGATPDQIEQLAHAFDVWAALLDRDGRPGALDVRSGPGTGASGGLGAGLAAVLGARLEPRFTALLDSGLAGFDLDALMARADLAITAEGAIDGQTRMSKVPAEVARRAQRTGTPVLALAGSLRDGSETVRDIGIDTVVALPPAPMPMAYAVANAEPLLRDAAERALRLIVLGAAIAAR
ncbi:glycerate kinase family protein [Actinoplanes couchii]|uniref:Glycerate kinase n=1 Tax=Actinoplanes couchii TaxID=403638 RepID=A0ABQ3XR58_9ACTN|nr:glycerate kinase [Actinoplanes couchii]MDR6318212.1 glycerate kinase [Actinoplanes couchii]GID61006.1 glycerate kinase [Actinoplanes couchii]